MVESFESWVKHIFDHPVAKPEWYWEYDTKTAYETLPSELTVYYLTRLFTNCPLLLGAYSDAQVNQGLDYLINPASGDYFREFYEPSVALEKRLEGIRSIAVVFSELFALRCTEQLSHLDEKGASPLNAICYMWWDIVP